MMKLRKISSVVLASLLVASSLVGCGGQGQTTTASSGAATGEASGAKTGPKGEKLAAEQVFNGRQSNVITFDSSKETDSESGTILRAITEGLFRENNGELQPAGCEKYEVSEDGLTYTFHLRKNKWSDGVEVVASQYVDAVIRVLNQDLGCGYAFFAFPIKNAEKFYNGEVTADQVGVEAVDDYTYKITLEYAEPYFVQKLAHDVFSPIRLDNIEKYGDSYGTDAAQMLSCGPFIIDEYIPEQSTHLVKNPDYWDAEHVYLNEINLTQIDETATQAQSFEAGELDVMGAVGDYAPKYRELVKQGQLWTINHASTQTQYEVFNCRENNPSGLMQNAKIRKAIAYSLDSQEFIDSVWSRFIPAYGLVPPTLLCGEKEFRANVEEPMKAEYDEYVNKPEKLQALFHEGLKELGKDTDDLSTITVQYLTYGQTTIAKNTEEYIVQSIQKNLGIKVELNSQGDFGLADAAKKAGEFDFTGTLWGADYNDPMTFIDMFLTDGPNNDGKYSNAKYDEILNKLKTELDLDKRMALYAEAEKLLISEDMAIKPLLYRDVESFIHNKVKGYQIPSFGAMAEYKNVYIVEE